MATWVYPLQDSLDQTKDELLIKLRDENPPEWLSPGVPKPNNDETSVAEYLSYWREYAESSDNNTIGLEIDTDCCPHQIEEQCSEFIDTEDHQRELRRRENAVFKGFHIWTYLSMNGEITEAELVATYSDH